MAPLYEKEHAASILTQVGNYLLENLPDVTFIMDLPQEQLKRSRAWVDTVTMANKDPKLKADKRQQESYAKGKVKMEAIQVKMPTS